MHTLQYVGKSDTDATFECTTCATTINFNLPGVGDPCAIDLQDGTYAPPDNPDQWMSPCTQ